MAYGLKACSCHPLKWPNTKDENRDSVLRLCREGGVFQLFYLTQMNWETVRVIHTASYTGAVALLFQN